MKFARLAAHAVTGKQLVSTAIPGRGLKGTVVRYVEQCPPQLLAILIVQ